MQESIDCSRLEYFIIFLSGYWKFAIMRTESRKKVIFKMQVFGVSGEFQWSVSFEFLDVTEILMIEKKMYPLNEVSLLRAMQQLFLKLSHDIWSCYIFENSIPNKYNFNLKIIGLFFELQSYFLLPKVRRRWKKTCGKAVHYVICFEFFKRSAVIFFFFLSRSIIR